MKIRSNKLTTCRVAADGETIELEFADAAGTPVTLQFPFLQAEAVAMTLPHLLSRAVIVTLRTTDGFEVSFGITRATCRALGWSLQYEADGAAAADVDADEAGEGAGNAPPPGRSGLN